MTAYADGLTFKTKDEKSYRDVHVEAMDANGLSLFGDFGQAQVAYNELPPELSARYGYDKAELDQYLKQGLDGVYQFGTGFTGETLQLKKGRYVHGTFSDAGGGPPDEKGAFTVVNNWVILKSAQGWTMQYALAVLHGHLVLMESTVYMLWKERGDRVFETGPSYHALTRQ